MPRFPFYQAPALAFYSADLYRDIARRWRGLGMGYLLVLLMVIWIPSALEIRSTLNEFRQDMAPPVIAQLPTIDIVNGEARVQGETPRTIRDNEGLPLMLIDLEAGPEALDNSSAMALLTRTHFYVRQGGRSGQARVLDLDGLDGLTIDRQGVTSLINGGTRIITAIAFPAGVIWSFSYRLSQALVFAVIGLILANTMNLGLPYAALVRISVVALTPLILIRTVQNLASFSIPLWWLVGFVIFVAYLYFGLQAVRDAPAEPVAPEDIDTNL